MNAVLAVSAAALLAGCGSGQGSASGGAGRAAVTRAAGDSLGLTRAEARTMVRENAAEIRELLEKLQRGERRPNDLTPEEQQLLRAARIASARKRTSE